MFAMAASLRISKSAISLSKLDPENPPNRIKQRVASYHTTEVIAHQTPKQVIANCVPKLVVMATSLSTYGPVSYTHLTLPTNREV